MKAIAVGRTPKSYLNSDLIEALGASYVPTAEAAVVDEATAQGGFDLTFEVAGNSSCMILGADDLCNNKAARSNVRQPHYAFRRKPSDDLAIATRRVILGE